MPSGFRETALFSEKRLWQEIKRERSLDGLLRYNDIILPPQLSDTVMLACGMISFQTYFRYKLNGFHITKLIS